MICAKCGANNPPEAAYCGGCGSSLASRPVASGQAAPAASPFASAPVISGEDSPTLRSISETLTTPAPQPVPAPGEQFQFGTPTPPVTPGTATNPPVPTPAPGFSSGAYSAQQPALAPGFSSGAYSAQPAAPVQAWPAPVQGVAATPGLPSGAYPPTSGAEFPAAVYPAPGAAFTSGAYPPVTPTPGQMSGVYPGQPSQPDWNAYAGHPSQPGWGAYPGQAPAPAQGARSETSGLIKPLPLWAFITSIIVVTLILAVLLFFTGSDWSAGAQTAGIAALVVGGLLLIAFGVRSALGMLAVTNVHRRSQIISALLLALILFAVGAIGLTQGLGIHAAEAHFLEAQQKWSQAVSEYQLSGQSAPASDDMARTYVEWGEQLSSQQQYKDAVSKFSTVIATYTQASTEVARAQKDSITAYQNWGASASQQKDYAGATQHYDALLGQSYCTGSCQSQISKLDATAYYNLAEQALTAQKYSDSATAFGTLTTKFANSPEAQRAHADYAKALWGEGQAQITSTCSSAVATYQQLATNFSDTTEGQQAAAALKQPQGVKGHFTTTIPGGTNTPEVGLAQNINANMSSNAFYAILAKSPVVTVHSDGTFQFSPVPQGTYYLVWGVVNTADNMEDFLVGQRYPATVGPLCAFNFGDLNEQFPTA